MSSVPCKTCGTPTHMKGTQLCDPCWEVERRLENYLHRGGTNAREFVASALAQAATEAWTKRKEDT